MSPKGLEGIEDNRGGGKGSRVWAPWFRLDDGASAFVRFLESAAELTWEWFHQLPPRGKQRYGDWEVCLDPKAVGDPCPGCELEFQQRKRGFCNIIWRDAPVWERDSNGRVVEDANGKWVQAGTADGVHVWRMGVNLIKLLGEVDTDYKGLMSRDFKVKAMTQDFRTYTVVPADPDGGPKPLSKEDKELTKDKFDLDSFIAPPTYDEWGGGIARQQQPLAAAGGSAASPWGPRTAPATNPFTDQS